MKKTIEETNYRREKQQEFNKVNNIVPRQREKTLENVVRDTRFMFMGSFDCFCFVLLK